MLKENQIKRVCSVIDDPAHGKEFYTKEMFTELLGKIEEVLNQLGIDEKRLKVKLFQE